MLKRIITAIVLLAVVLGTLFGLRQLSLFYVDALILICMAVGVYEMCTAFRAAKYRPMAIPLIIAVLGIYPALWFLRETGIVAVIAVAVMIALTIFTFDHKYELKDFLATAFILFYPIVLLSLFFLINGKTTLGDNPANENYGDMIGIMLALFIPVFTDTFAYFTGMAIGGVKLCPEISPKKTVAGAIGGLFGGMAASVMVFLMFDYYGIFDTMSNVHVFALTTNLYTSLAVYLTVGLVGAVVSEVGDLAASWIKRKAGIKDFGKIFPGHGGIMDRLDSIMFVLPVIYLTFAIINAVG